MSPQCEEAEIDEIRIVAVDMLEIDCDLPNAQWHGFNIVIMAANIHVVKACKWDVSGKSRQEIYKQAENGKRPGEDGKDGKDGCAGESSGNVMITADKMQNPERLTVILNGGSGSSGQDGGDGANGMDGTGISLSDLNECFPSPMIWMGWLWKFHRCTDLFIKVKNMGKTTTIWEGGEGTGNAYVEVELDNGQNGHIQSVVPPGTVTCCIREVKVSEGGKGGLNGLGGEGGYKGECTVVSRQNEQFPVEVQSMEGKEGLCSKHGRMEGKIWKKWLGCWLYELQFMVITKCVRRKSKPNDCV